jgi:adenylosuccinate synthase
VQTLYLQGALPQPSALDLTSDAVIENFLMDVDVFMDRVEIASWDEIAMRFQSIVFEGAQGLGLDEHYGAFPHVTRCRTGLTDVIHYAERAEITELEVTYVTRTYLTRHGAGPLPGETGGPPYPGIVDKTNVQNPWQGSLRFAPLDPYETAKLIASDLGQARIDMAVAGGIKLNPSLAMTCCDQVPDDVMVGHYQTFRRLLSFPRTYLGEGPTRENIVVSTTFA